MLHAGAGLTGVGTRDLEKALAALHRGGVRFPLDIGELARHGLQQRAGDLLGALRGLDERGARAVLVCVLAERRARSTGLPGPEDGA